MPDNYALLRLPAGSGAIKPAQHHTQLSFKHNNVWDLSPIRTQFQTEINVALPDSLSLREGKMCEFLLTTHILHKIIVITYIVCATKSMPRAVPVAFLFNCLWEKTILAFNCKDITRRPDVRPTKIFIQSFKSLLHDTTVLYKFSQSQCLNHQYKWLDRNYFSHIYNMYIKQIWRPLTNPGTSLESLYIAHTVLDIPFTEVKVSVGRFTWKFTVH